MDNKPRRQWLFWLLAVGLAASAALSYYGYVGNGITAGSLIGLPGREADAAKLQQYAGWWLAAAVMSQAGVAIGLYFLLDFVTDVAPLRFAMRSFLALLISFPFTFLVTAIMVAGLRWFEGVH